MTTIEEDGIHLERSQKELSLERVRRRKEVERKEQQQRERKKRLEEEENVREERKQRLLLLNRDVSCLLVGGEEREREEMPTEKGIVPIMAEFTGLEKSMSIEEMMNACWTIDLKRNKKYLQEKKREGEKEKEKHRQERDELLHQLHVIREHVDEQVMNRLEEEQQERDQLQSVQSIILHDLEKCEVGL